MDDERDGPGRSDDLPPPPEAQPTDRWTLDPGAIVPGRRAGPSADDGGEPSARRRHRVLLGVLAAVAVLLVAGGAAAFVFLRGSSADLLERVPADVDGVMVAYLDPSASQKLNVARLADAFPGAGGTGGVRDRLEEWGNEVLQDTNLRFDDVADWLGVEVAVTVDVVDDEPQVAILAHVDDRDAAELMLAKLQASGAPWEGVTYAERDHLGTTIHVSDDEDTAPSYAFDDDVLVLASDAGLLERVIDTHRGTTEAFASTASFQETEASLPDDRLVLGFIDMTSLQSRLEDLGATDAAASLGGLGDLSAIEGIGMSMSAESDGIAVDVVAAYDAANLTGALRDQVTAPDHVNPLLPSVPADAWGVFGAQHVQYGVQEAVDGLEAQDPAIASDLRSFGLTGGGGLLEALTGDVAVSVSPDRTSTVGGALLLGVDGAAARSAVAQVADAVAAAFAGGDGTGVWQTERAADGTEISSLPDGFGAYALRDGMLVIGTTVEQVAGVLAAEEQGSLVDDPAYARGIAGVPTTDSLFFVDVARVVESIREALPPDELARFDQEFRADLRTIRSVAFGIDMNETRQRLRLFVAIRAEDDVTA